MLIKGILFLVMALAIHGVLIKRLNQLSMQQHIYELSPETHQAKAKTPSMGGIAIALSICVGFFWFELWSPALSWVLLLTGCFTGMGFLDDYLSKQKKRNQGLTTKQKFGLQLLAAGGFVWAFHFFVAPLSILMALFYTFIIVGTSNATNLTDGLDGLLGGLSVLTLLGFAVLFFQQVMHQEVSFVLMAILSVLAFLWFNRYPAKVFMGDTGSLALGALFAGLAMIYGNPWVLLPLGVVYILETLSVIIQVGWYKRSKQRLFLMAPLHHHFELMGLHEQRVVALFWGLQALFLLGYFFLNWL